MQRAGYRLIEARSSAELLEAKALAEAALHYAKVTKAANETHADCLRIITRAEMRMANEIDRGQASGDIARNGQHGEAVQTSDSLDLDRRRVSEWRDVRDAGADVVEDAISQALADGRPPTKTDIVNRAREAVGKALAKSETLGGLRSAIRESMVEAFGEPPARVVHHREKSDPAAVAFTDFSGAIRTMAELPEDVMAGLASRAEPMILDYYLGHCRIALARLTQFTKELEKAKRNAA
jgi:hypothetical protein